MSEKPKKLRKFAKSFAEARKTAKAAITETPVASKPKLGAFAKRVARKRAAPRLKGHPIPIGGHVYSALPPLQRKKFQRN